MKRHTKTMIAALGATLFAIAPAVANAERVFLLVGTRHVYKIGSYEYAHVDERRAIEQNYADQVATDQEQFNKAVAEGASPAEEGANLNAALDDLAAQRDQQLAGIYATADYELNLHPELRIEGDGPYQVMAINYHWRGSLEVFDDYRIYAPWDGYVVVDRPYGWDYGRIYRPYEFREVYTGWHGRWVAGGRYAFVGMYGRGGYVRYNIDRRYRFERQFNVHHLKEGDRNRYIRNPIGRPDHNKPWNRPVITRPFKTKPYERPISNKPYERPINNKPIEKPIDNKPYGRPFNNKPYGRPIDSKPTEKSNNYKPYERPINNKPADRPIRNRPTPPAPAHPTPVAPPRTTISHPNKKG